MTLNCLDVVEPLALDGHFQFWEHPRVAVSYVGTVRRLAKLCNLVFRQKLLHKVRWMRWRVIVVKKPVTTWPETRSFSSHGITQSFQNFNVIFVVDRLTSWSKFVVHNTLRIEKNNQHWLDMAPTLTSFFRPWLVWMLPLWRLLFSFRIVTINPWFITSNNLLKDIFIITDHFQVIQSDFRAKVVSNFGMDFEHTRVIPKILFEISQTVVFGIPRLFSSSRTVNRRSPSIASGTRSMFFGVVLSEGRPERGSTDVRPFLNRLYHSFIYVMPILSSTNAFCIISIVSVQLLPRLKRNLIQIRWSFLSVIFNCKQMRRTEKARWT